MWVQGSSRNCSIDLVISFTVGKNISSRWPQSTFYYYCLLLKEPSNEHKFDQVTLTQFNLHCKVAPRLTDSQLLQIFLQNCLLCCLLLQTIERYAMNLKQQS